MSTLSSQELKYTLAVSIKCNLIWQETHFISNVDIEGSCIAFLPIEMTVIHQLLFHFILLWCSISQRNALIFGKVYPVSSFPCCLSNKNISCRRHSDFLLYSWSSHLIASLSLWNPQLNISYSFFFKMNIYRSVNSFRLLDYFSCPCIPCFIFRV